MQVKFKDNSKEVMQALLNQLDRNIEAACIHLTSTARENVNVTQPYVISGERRHGLDPSAPGEYPKKVTGYGQRSIAYQKKGFLWYRFGTGVKYMAYLNNGTSRMAARPWLIKTVEEQQTALRKILAVQPK